MFFFFWKSQSGRFFSTLHLYFPTLIRTRTWAPIKEENSLTFNFLLPCGMRLWNNIWFSVWRSVTLLLLLFRLRLHFINEFLYCFIVDIRDTAGYTWHDHFEESFMFGIYLASYCSRPYWKMLLIFSCFFFYCSFRYFFFKAKNTPFGFCDIKKMLLKFYWLVLRLL